MILTASRHSIGASSTITLFLILIYRHKFSENQIKVFFFLEKMSIQDESTYSHRIYNNDPIKFKSYINKRVIITANDSSYHEGIVYTVDPVSESVILIKQNDANFQGQIIIGDSIKTIEILSDEEERIPEFFESKSYEFSVLEIQEKKKRIMKLLNENRFPVTEENDVLKIQDVISIEPPYKPYNCLCSNPIIMTRIRGIISQIEDN